MNRSTAPHYIVPQWSAPAAVQACFTTRRGGHSAAPWDSFNLATHVGDDRAAVALNRARLRAELGLAHEPAWLEQVHGAEVHRAAPGDALVRADACVTRVAGLACTVMVADCVPLLLCAADGSEVAAVHAGWRGLASNIIARAVGAFGVAADAQYAWIGPCISAPAYAVGEELRAQFVSRDPATNAYFRPAAVGWHMDLRGLAAAQLRALGVAEIVCSSECVFAEHDSFFSYRREPCTGRMAGLIWINGDAE